MEKWIGKSPTSKQKSLAGMYKSLLTEAQSVYLANDETVLKIAGTVYKKKGSQKPKGILALTNQSVHFFAQNEHLMLPYNDIKNLSIGPLKKKSSEEELTLVVGSDTHVFEWEKNDDNQEFIEVLKYKMSKPNSEIVTTVTHDFRTFLHKERVQQLKAQGVHITSFVEKRDDQGPLANVERILKEKYQNVKMVLSGSFLTNEKKGNFIAVMEDSVIFFDYNNKTQNISEVSKLSLDFFSNATIDYFTLKQEIHVRDQIIRINSRVKKFEEILSGNGIPFTVKSRKRYQKIPGFRSGKRWKMVLATLLYGVVLLIVVGIAVGNAQSEKQATAHYEKAEEYVNEGKIDQALEEIRASKELEPGEENPALALESMIEQSRSKEAAIEAIQNMSDSDFELLKKGELKTTYIEHEVLNQHFIQELSKYQDERAKYLAEKEKKKQEEEKEKRRKMIENSFSAWDGSHRNLTKFIKANMNDPDSYEHVETRYRDNNDHLIVQTTFRGKNAFGGVVINTVIAKVSLDGEVLEIIDQS
jgi:hypothetical protein